MRSHVRAVPLALALLLALPAGGAVADPVVPEGLPAPILGHELSRGTGRVVPAPAIAPAAKIVDGGVGDWVGRPSRFAGTAVYSGGEYVYQDHLFDSYGADDGTDVRTNGERWDPMQAAAPDTYRLEAIARYLGGEVGLPGGFGGETTYGDLGPLFSADLEEVRVAVDAEHVHVLARTTTLTSPRQTALLVIVDVGGGQVEREVPFASGLRTARGDAAALLAGSSGWVARLGTKGVTALPDGLVATQPAGFTNAIEASIPRSALGLGPGAGTLRISVSAGPFDAAKNAFASTGLPANVANVAFRTAEPVREWFEKQQAFALNARSVDPFFASIDLARLGRAATERYVPGPGYHERVFVSTEEISREGGRDPIWQHYGLFLPSSYREGTKLPLQWWLHWRGGNAHSAGSATPDVFRMLGERQRSIVVSPRGRGTSRWYVGVGHVDFLQVWEDVFDSFAVDDRRVYLAGHSMGGWGSYLLSILYPDRFAGALPASPPQTQGLWTGLDFPGCDEMTTEFDGDEYALCYSPANEGRPRDQALRPMLTNLRHVPVAVYHGAADELVWYPGVARNSLRLSHLGYRNRLYTFLTQEHYGPPLWDEWKQGAKYLHSFVLDPNPSRVTYRRDMRFERAVEEVQAEGATLSFDFDRAYWMSGLTPANPADGAATFDGRSRAIPEEPYLTVPEAGGPATLGQTGPYLMEGLRWEDDPTTGPPAAANGFEATLSGARAVTLDLPRMEVDAAKPVEASVTTDRVLDLRLRGPWTGTPIARTAAGTRLSATVSGDELLVRVPAGTTAFTIRQA